MRVQYAIRLLDATDEPGRYTWHDEFTLDSSYAEADADLVDLLVDVAQAIDSATCRNCQNQVGYGLRGDADEQMVWQPCVVMAVGEGQPYVVCEGCSPALPTETDEMFLPVYVDGLRTMPLRPVSERGW